MNKDYLIKTIDEENERMRKTDDCYFYDFNYRGIQARVKRTPMDFMGYLCGYILLGTDEKFDYEAINSAAHGGITYNRNGIIGFDCAHKQDVNPFNVLNLDLENAVATYKTLDFCIATCKAMIDAHLRSCDKHER